MGAFLTFTNIILSLVLATLSNGVFAVAATHINAGGPYYQSADQIPWEASAGFEGFNLF